MAGRRKAANLREVATSEPATVRQEESEEENEDEIQVDPDTQSQSDTADRDAQVEGLKEQVRQLERRLRGQQVQIKEYEAVIRAKDRVIIQQAQQIAEQAASPAMLPSIEVPRSTISNTGQRKGGDVVALKDGSDPTVTNWIMLIRDKFHDEPHNYPDEPSRIRYGRRRLEGIALSRVGAYLQRGKDFDSLDSFFQFLRNNLGNKNRKREARDWFNSDRKNNWWPHKAGKTFGDWFATFQDELYETAWPEEDWKEKLHMMLPRDLQLNTSKEAEDDSVDYAEFAESVERLAYILERNTSRSNTRARRGGRTVHDGSSDRNDMARHSSKPVGGNTDSGSVNRHTSSAPRTRRSATADPPARTETRTCFECGRTGHLSRDCPAKEPVAHQVNMGSQPSSADESEN